MIILGELYKFSDSEIKILNKKFDNIDFIKYKKADPNDVISKIENIKNKKSVDYIVLNTMEEIPNELIKYLIKNKMNYLTIRELFENEFNKYFISPRMNNVDFLSTVKTYSKFEYFQKRVIDYILSLTLLFITFPIMIYSAWRIKKESPDGPVFFKQKRVGKDNKKFECLKFRSMRTDVDYFNKYTQENDPRIFPWGMIMRRMRIDELPQVFNVLKGDMHFIGPRAEWDILVEEYEENIPYYMARHIVKPGITGWAQVKYPYGISEDDAKEKLMYDLYYIKNWSILLELKTVIKTILVILNKEGI